MKTRITILIFFSTLLFSASCTDHHLLKGHWHLMSTQIIESEFESDAILNYYNKFGVWNEKIELFWGGFGVYLDTWNNQMDITNANCYTEKFNYRIKSDSLLLFNSDNKIVFRGYRCSEECCDKEQDYFLLTGLKIRLPKILDTTNCKKLGPYEKGTFTKIFVGKDKISGNWKLDFGFNRTNVNEIEILLRDLEETYQYESTGKYEIILYVDPDVEQEFLDKILHELNINGVKEVYFAAKEDNELNEDLRIWLIQRTTFAINYDNEFLYPNWISEK